VVPVAAAELAAVELVLAHPVVGAVVLVHSCLLVVVDVELFLLDSKRW
jgi:hypothetical protein